RLQLTALKESDDRLRFLMQSSSEGILIHENGVITDVNDAIQNMLAYTHDEMVGKHITSFLTPKEHESIMQLIKSGAISYGERELLDKHGGIHYLEARNKTVIWKGRELRVITMNDVSELHEKRIDEQRLISVIDASPFYVAMMDATGLRYMNPV